MISNIIQCIICVAVLASFVGVTLALHHLLKREFDKDEDEDEVKAVRYTSDEEHYRKCK